MYVAGQHKVPDGAALWKAAPSGSPQAQLSGKLHRRNFRQRKIAESCLVGKSEAIDWQKIPLSELPSTENEEKRD